MRADLRIPPAPDRLQASAYHANALAQRERFLRAAAAALIDGATASRSLRLLPGWQALPR